MAKRQATCRPLSTGSGSPKGDPETGALRAGVLSCTLLRIENKYRIGSGGWVNSKLDTLLPYSKPRKRMSLQREHWRSPECSRGASEGFLLENMSPEPNSVAPSSLAVWPSSVAEIDWANASLSPTIVGYGERDPKSEV